MLNGLSASNLDHPPPVEKIKDISPMAHLKDGTYQVPTFIIHADKDEITPFRDSEDFAKELKARGIEGGLSQVKGKKHIHDLALKPETEGWYEGVGVGYDFVFDQVSRS